MPLSDVISALKCTQLNICDIHKIIPLGTEGDIYT